MRDITLTGSTDADWFQPAQRARRAPQPLHDVDAVLMRKDPPFDAEYIYATHLLEQAEREGARVFNRPRALRDHPEKLAILEFPQFIGPTLVTRDAADMPRASTPSTATSSSSRWTAWAAWASSASGPTA